MKSNKLTLIGLLLAITVYLFSVIGQVDLFESLISVLKETEELELDKLIIPIMIFYIFALWDLLREKKSAKIENEKAKIYMAMSSSSHHILNNFLSQMQSFRLIAVKTPGFPAEALAKYDKIMKDALLQINALDNIKNIDETSILESVTEK